MADSFCFPTRLPAMSGHWSRAKRRHGFFQLGFEFDLHITFRQPGQRRREPEGTGRDLTAKITRKPASSFGLPPALLEQSMCKNCMRIASAMRGNSSEVLSLSMTWASQEGIPVLGDKYLELPQYVALWTLNLKHYMHYLSICGENHNSYSMRSWSKSHPCPHWPSQDRSSSWTSAMLLAAMAAMPAMCRSNFQSQWRLPRHVTEGNLWPKESSKGGDTSRCCPLIWWCVWERVENNVGKTLES